MELHTIDWIIIIAFLGLSLYIGLKYKNQAEGSLSNFFLGGRNLPWYIAGISMVATTFAADTPLAVTEIVNQNGISGNWLWWNFLIGGLLTTFFFAKLWRKSGVLTELEFIQLRYGGKEALWLRGFKSIYLGLFINGMIIGWVNLAMIDIIEVFFGVQNGYAYCIALMGIAVLYSSLSGLKGVAITDTIQFIIAMTGTIVLAILVLNSDKVGGIDGLKAKLPENYLNFFPKIGSDTSGSNLLTIPLGAFIAFAGMQWWASWYPGAEPGGGGYIAQRMMSTKTEKDSFLATLFFQVGHYCLRPWPWILVALASIALYAPQLNNQKELYNLANDLKNVESKETLKTFESSYQVSFDEETSQAILEGNQTTAVTTIANQKDFSKDQLNAFEFSLNSRKGYLFTIRDFLPIGLKGLLLVAFLAAYLSTISTQINWGASYLVNDLYTSISKRENNLVNVSRIASVLIMIFGAFVTLHLTSIKAAWEIIMECGAGLGLVLILRWFWSRINIWSEITATMVPFIGYFIIRWFIATYYDVDTIQWINDNKIPFILNVLITTLSWLIVTFITPKTNEEHLSSFFKKVAPFRTVELKLDKKQISLALGLWITSIVLIYSILFSGGYLFLKEWKEFGLSLLSVLISGALFIPLFKRFNS